MIPRRGRPGGRGVSFPILLLAMQMMQVGFDHIPPVTLLAILGQVGLFLRLLDIPLPGISEVCISPINVWYKEDYSRLLLANFFHATDWHLYYNMVSFLWKGRMLERRLGSPYFAYMVAVFAILSSTTTVALGMAAEELLDDRSYLYGCAVGFSGVLFALKVVTNHMSPAGRQYIMGWFPVPSGLACWAELLLIQILVPNASFLGHLAGILVGLAYVKGPLKYIMDIPVSLVRTATPSGPSYTYQSGSTGRTVGGRSGQNPYRTSGSGASGQPSYGWFGRPSGDEASNGVPPNGRYQNPAAFPRAHEYTGGMSEEEQIAEALRQSEQDYARWEEPPVADYPRAEPSAPTLPPSYESVRQNRDHYSTAPHSEGLYPDLTSLQNEANARNEEMRRRRLQRFQ